MRAFEIYINGGRVCVAGVNDSSVLNAIVDYVGRDKEECFHLHVGGLLIPEEEHVTWQDKDLAVGDDVRIKVVEVEKIDKPTKRFPKNPKRDIQAQKRYVKKMAKKFGWKIQIRRKQS
jgi:hypothetical protein